MECKIIATGILKHEDKYLVVKRSDDDNFLPGSWEFPGGNLEIGETILEGLKRELNEEIGFNITNEDVKLIGYSDEIKNNNNSIVHVIEFDFLVDCLNEDINILLSNEHSEYRWVTKDFELLDDFILSKIKKL